MENESEVTDAEFDGQLLSPTHPPRIKPCGGCLFASCVLATLPELMSDIWVDSLCGHGLVDPWAAVQVGLTGGGVEGHLEQEAGAFLAWFLSHSLLNTRR